jgi:hypothetical protein
MNSTRHPQFERVGVRPHVHTVRSVNETLVDAQEGRISGDPKFCTQRLCHVSVDLHKSDSSGYHLHPRLRQISPSGRNLLTRPTPGGADF